MFSSTPSRSLLNTPERSELIINIRIKIPAENGGGTLKPKVAYAELAIAKAAHIFC